MALHIVDHPLIRQQVTRLRDARTPAPAFRAAVRELTRLVLYGATQHLATAEIDIMTPVGPTIGHTLTDRIGLFPVLRAGLGMLDAALELMPDATVWHLGLYRDEATLQPVTYYSKLPGHVAVDLSLVLDPMLATGGSATAACDHLKKHGATRIAFVGLIAAPEGIAALQAAHPNVDIFVAAQDSHLNRHGYIVPGLGDAGDRQFGTVVE